MSAIGPWRTSRSQLRISAFRVIAAITDDGPLMTQNGHHADVVTQREN
jgi:hypothetical protein